MKIKTNKVYRSLVDNPSKIIAHQGGTRSGKTYNILLWIIFDYCARNQGKIITVCRKAFPSLRATVMRDFLDILRKHDMYSEDSHNKSNSEYTLNRNLVEFISLDQPQKIRGRKRDLLFINEGNETTREDFFQLNVRTKEQIIIDYNPSDEYHWIYDDLITRDDCDFHITTYKDNPFLDPSIKLEIERLKDTDEQYWQIYGLGLKGVSKATIFTFSEVNQIPEDAEFLSSGMDFGFNDPTTMVDIYRKDHNIYVKELLYRTGMTGDDIAKFLKGIDLQGIIYADSARPEIIEQLRRMGIPMRPTKKGQGSILEGIDIMKRYKIHITSDSHNLIQEMRNYKWTEDKTGKLTNAPLPKNDHLVDALRYSIYNVLSNPSYGKYTIM